MPEGFDVRPDGLRRGAADLRTDVGALEGARGTASAAARQAADAAGTGPLAGAVHDLAVGLDRVVTTLRQGIDESADALDATAAQYVTTDQRSASGLGRAQLPGSDPPR